VGSTKSAMLYPVLLPGRSLEESKQFFSDVFNAAYRRSDASIALLGMGTDGHIAGILPNSVAANESQELVAAYQSEPYQRLTLTFPALRMLTGVYTFAFGDGKNEALTILQEQTLPVTEQPAQFLKELPDSYLYNDQKGEKV
jgi:6-phosphogluconolactonase